MFRDGTQFPKENINFLFDDGGLGDNICRMVTMKYIKDHYPYVTPYLYVPDYFLQLARHLIPDMIIRPFSKGPKLYNKTFAGRQTAVKQHDSFATHLVDHAFHVLSNRQVEIQDKNYLPLKTDKIHIEKFKLPKKYVVVTTGFTAPIREFRPRIANTIINYLNEKNVGVVFLGSKQAPTGAENNDIIGNFNKEIDYSKGINLVDKTSLLEAGKIISESAAIVGVDNGLLHLAGCTEVPIIAGFTSVHPRHRLPYRHNELGWNCYTVVPPETVKERFFQSNWDFIYNFDYRYCYYGDYQVTDLNSEEFIAHLEKVL